MELLLSIPVLPPSALAPHTLETIPGSASPTPPTQSLRTSPALTPQHAEDAFGETAEAGPSRQTPRLSRRPSLVAPPPSMPGSYFAIGYSSQPAMSPSPSPATTPWERDRPRPPMLNIPPGTPDEPIFSNYPSTAPSRNPSIKGKQRPHVVPLASAFHLAEPIRRRKVKRHVSDSQGDEDSSESSPGSQSQGLWWQRRTKSRRRAATVSNTPPETPPLTSPTAEPIAPPEIPPKSPLRSRRRASVGSVPYGADFAGQTDGPFWPSMPQEEAKRMHPEPEIPFAYPQPAPHPSSLSLSPTSPNITPRRSSLASGITIQGYNRSSPSLHMSPNKPLLGLSGIYAESEPQILIPEDDAIPHEPPPRRSSLSFGPDVVIDIKAISPVTIPDLPSPHGDQSVLSASFSTTEESGSAEFFSPTSSGAHPLSSATTSLSRSAKSGKDGASDEAAKDASLSALKLQRSLEWEAKQAKHRRKLEKRRMILLEMVETEVAYAEDLKALVEVYLPQLHALPSVPERTAAAVGRNAAELLAIHSALSVKMVEVLKEEGLEYEMLPDEDLVGKVERVSRKLASALVDKAPSLSAYNEFCAGSVMASTLVRNISLRTDYTAFERRCQIISSSNPPVRLQDLLDDTLPVTASSNKNRLHFRDYLIMPIQRVCRYPLLLAALLGAADTPSLDHPSFPYVDSDGEVEAGYDVGVDVERALGALRGVAEEADEARRQKESEIKSATILARLEPHPVLTPPFIKSLGPCRLIGSLDVLHHHPTIAPLVPPVKVKYLAAFLYRGYLVLAKVKKGKVYEAKHFLPLEVFELIDIAEGFLPHSIRLSLREHSFDIAASCEAEKEIWACALAAARDESTVPPFELPASVSPFAARTRRMSNVGPSLDMTAISPVTPNKRHSLAGLPRISPSQTTIEPILTPSDSPELDTPSTAPASFSGTILLRRAAPNQRLTVDRGLLDVFSESCAQARSKAQLNHALFLPDIARNSLDMRDRLVMRDSTMLKRRRSFLDARQHRRASSNVDIAFSGEVKGSVIPIRPSKSFAESGRAEGAPVVTRRRGSSFTGSVRGTEESSTEMDGADDTATSDFGTLRGYGMRTSASPSISPLKSTRGTFRPGLEPINSAVVVPQSQPTASPISPLTSTTFISGSSNAPTRFASLRKSVRKSASVVNLYQRPAVPNRAMSTPTSPLLRAQEEKEKESPVKRSSSDPDRPLPNRHKTLGPTGLEVPDKGLPPLPPPKERPVFVSIRDEGGVGEHGEVVKEDGSLSSSSTRAAVSRSGSTSSQHPLAVDTTTSPPPGPVYSLGNGLTKTPDRTLASSPWGSLRRTLTNRSQRNSLVSLEDAAGAGSSPASPARGRTQSAQPTHSRSSSFGPEQTALVGLGVDDSIEREKMRSKGSEVAGGEEDGAVILPRRSRSVRLLRGLRSLTAM